MFINSQSMRELERTTRSIRASSAFGYSPEKTKVGQRTAESLYQLDRIQRDKISQKRQDKEVRELTAIQNSKFKNQESEKIRIEGF